MLFCPRCYKLWPDTADVATCDCGYEIDKMEATPELHPVQMGHMPRSERSKACAAVVMAAYEVYCHVYSPQSALVTGHCRGGLGISELVAFLYARSFSKSEWRQRVDEAFAGNRIDRV